MVNFIWRLLENNFRGRRIVFNQSLLVCEYLCLVVATLCSCTGHVKYPFKITEEKTLPVEQFLNYSRAISMWNKMKKEMSIVVRTVMRFVIKM